MCSLFFRGQKKLKDFYYRNKHSKYLLYPTCSPHIRSLSFTGTVVNLHVSVHHIISTTTMSSWFTKLIAPAGSSNTSAGNVARDPQREREERAVQEKRYQLTKDRLRQFYQHWNPNKLSEVPHLAKSFKGREIELWQMLKQKYVDRAQLPDGSLQQERDENIYTFILVCRRRNVPEVIARRVHSFSRNLHFWDYCGLRRPEDYFGEQKFRNRDRALAEMVQYQESELKKSLIDLGIHRHKDRVVDMGVSESVDVAAKQIFRLLTGYMDENIGSLTDRKKKGWARQRRTSVQKLRIIIKNCTRTPLMIDETFMQVMKQLKGNSGATSVYRGWQILVILCSVMLPSRWMRRFVTHFLETRLNDGLKGQSNKSKNDSSISSSRIRFAQITSAYAKFALGVYKSACERHSGTPEAHVHDVENSCNQSRFMAMQRSMPMTVHIVLPDASHVCHVLVWPDQTIENVILVALNKLGCKQCEFVKYGLAMNPRHSLHEMREMREMREKEEKISISKTMTSSSTMNEEKTEKAEEKKGDISSSSDGIDEKEKKKSTDSSRVFKTSRHFITTPTDSIVQRRLLLNSVTPGGVLQWIAAPHMEMCAGCTSDLGLSISDSEVQDPYASVLLESRDSYDRFAFDGSLSTSYHAEAKEKLRDTNNRFFHQDYQDMIKTSSMYSNPKNLKEIFENSRNDLLHFVFKNGELTLELVQRYLCSETTDPYSAIPSFGHRPSAGCCSGPKTRYIQYLQCLDDATCGRLPLDESDAGLAAALAMEIDRRLAVPVEQGGEGVFPVSVSKTMKAAQKYVTPRLLRRHPLPAWSRKIATAHRKVLQGIDAVGDTLFDDSRSGDSRSGDSKGSQQQQPPPPRSKMVTAAATAVDPSKIRRKMEWLDGSPMSKEDSDRLEKTLKSGAAAGGPPKNTVCAEGKIYKTTPMSKEDSDRLAKLLPQHRLAAQIARGKTGPPPMSKAESERMARSRGDLVRSRGGTRGGTRRVGSSSGSSTDSIYGAKKKRGGVALRSGGTLRPRRRNVQPPPPPSSIGNNRLRRACRLLGIETCPPEEVVMAHENISKMRSIGKEKPHFVCEFGVGQLGLNIDMMDGCVLHIQEGTQASRWPALIEGDYIVTVEGQYIDDPEMIVPIIQQLPRPVQIGFRKSDEYLWRDHTPRPLLATLLDRFMNLLKRNRLFGAHLFPSMMHQGCMDELNRRFRVQEVPNQNVMVGVNNGGLHFWDVQRGLIETLDFCELVSWGQTRHYNWSTNDEVPNQQRKKIALSELSGFGSILMAGLQMQTLRLNIGVLKPPLIRRNQRIVITDAFDKVAGRIIRADRIARVKQARALRRRRSDRQQEQQQQQQTTSSGFFGQGEGEGQGESKTSRVYDGESTRSSTAAGGSSSLGKVMSLLQEMNGGEDGIGTAAQGRMWSTTTTKLNDENSAYYNHYDDEEDEYAYDVDIHGYGNHIPQSISITSSGIHVLSSLMLNVINGIMATKGFKDKDDNR